MDFVYLQALKSALALAPDADKPALQALIDKQGSGGAQPNSGGNGPRPTGPTG